MGAYVNLVLDDVLHADTIEFSCPATPLSMGRTHSSMDESIRSLFQEIGLELIEYDTMTRTPLNDGKDRPQRVHVRLMGAAWLRKLRK